MEKFISDINDDYFKRFVGYSLTDKGEFYSYRHPKFLGQKYKRVISIGRNGYQTIEIIDIETKKKHKMFLHRLIAKLFVPNPDNKPQVNHINGIKTDNRAENLEWVTGSENIRHAQVAGLKPTLKNGATFKKGGKAHNAIIIKKYDMNDNFIKEYKSMTDAIKENNQKRKFYNRISIINGFKYEYIQEGSTTIERIAQEKDLCD